jgi:proline iminopeptidase
MPRLEALKTKTCIVVGTEDALCSVAASEKIHDGISGSALNILEDCGHVSWIEKPDEYVKIVGQFLDS